MKRILFVLLLAGCAPVPDIDEVLGKTSCTTKVHNHQIKDISIAGATRMSSIVIIPAGLSQDEVKDVVHCRIKEIHGKYPKASINLMLQPDDLSGFTLFAVDFAPHGEWEKASDNANFSDYKVHYKLWTEDYFK